MRLISSRNSDIVISSHTVEEDTPPSPTPDVSQASQESSVHAAAKKPMTMTYEAYKQMTNLILYHMKQQEQVAELSKCMQFSYQIFNKEIDVLC